MIMDEVHELFVHDVREMNERYLNTYATNNAIEHRKHTLIYFFNDEKIDLQFKALSVLEWLKEDFNFVSIYNPSKLLMEDYFIKSLPSIRGALAPLKEDEEVEPNYVQQF
jgi:hypothetical protein